MIRKILPNHLFLVPGFGAQGGSAQNAFSGLILNENIYEGGLINSSRAILFPEKSKKCNKIYDWRETIIMALNKAKKELMIN